MGHKVDIFNKINNKRRMTLSLTKPEFMKQCTEFVNKQNENDGVNLIPILMFNNGNNEYWIEYVMIVTLEQGIDVGIAFKMIPNHDIITVSGIHLDKVYLQCQHELVLPQHTGCHCLDTFESNINYLSIGNPDDQLNLIKYYKQQINGLTKYRDYIDELLKIAPNDVSQLQLLQKRISEETDTKLPSIAPSFPIKPSKSAPSLLSKFNPNAATFVSPQNHRNYRNHQVPSQNVETALNTPIVSMQQQSMQYNQTGQQSAYNYTVHTLPPPAPH